MKGINNKYSGGNEKLGWRVGGWKWEKKMGNVEDMKADKKREIS